jgi:lipopolysaccharide export system permease protein
MQRIDRFVAGEIIAPFLAALAFLFTQLFAMQMLRGIEVMFGSGVTAMDLARIAGYLAPHFLVMATPVSFLFAVMLAIGRLSEDREVVALAASGSAPWRLWLAPVGLGLVMAAIGISLGYGPEPNGLASVRLHVNELIKRNMAGDVKPGVFYDALSDMTLYAQGVSSRTRRFENVLIADERDPDSSMLLLARRGWVDPQGSGSMLKLVLGDGEIHRATGSGSDYAVVSFESGTLDIQVDSDLLRKNRFGAAKEELTSSELAEAAREARARGDQHSARSFDIARFKRVAAPLSTVVFALCAVPLALGGRRRSRGLGALATLLAYVGYYVLVRTGDVLGEGGKLPALLAAHLPNLVFLGLSIVLVRRSTRAEG